MNNSVKITSGQLRGRKIATPGTKTHPMGSREKLALFNMISGDLAGARVLDAFAGSGALGIEAISRGAKEVVFVEKNPKAAKIIKENLKQLEIAGLVVTGDVANYEDEAGFDLIIADPPYNNYRVEAIFKIKRCLNRGGKLVLSHPGNAPEIDGLILINSRKYANATISVFVNS